MKNFLLSVCIILSALSVNAQIFITPNTADLGQTLQVFISGNSPSEFEVWSGTPGFLMLSINQWGDPYMDYYFEVPNNVQNWTWNSSVGSDGFYSTITLPSDINLAGNYDLYMDECEWCWMGLQIISSNAFVVTIPTAPYLGEMNRDDGEPGDELQVNISGGNIDVGSQWSVTSQLRFSQFSGTTNVFYNAINSWYDCYGAGNGTTSLCQEFEVYNMNIPWGQPTGVYDFAIWDNATNQWITSSSTFEILPPHIDNIDPNEGNQGQTLSVTISGQGMDYGDQWSGTLSDFRFSQYSGTNMFSGTPTSYYYESWGDNEKILYGDVSISSNQNPGWYDLEVWDYSAGQYIMQEDAFEVIQVSNTFTPNTADLGQTLQVFISGNSPSEFEVWSGTPGFLMLSINQWGDPYMDYYFEVPNNVQNWTWNSSVGSDGFYSTITLPSDINLAGNYDLYMDECEWCWMGLQIISSNAFVVTIPTAPYLGEMNRDDGEPGDELQVNISGGNIDVGSQWSVTSQLRFSQFSGTTNVFYNAINSWYDCYGAGNGTTSLCQEFEVYNMNIPWGQPTGVYDFAIWDNATNQWITSSSTFEILPPHIDNIDPNEGNQGQTLSVTISGQGMDYGDQWSGTLSDFRFSQYSGTNMFSGTPTSYYYESWGDNEKMLYGDVSISSNQNPGWYDLEVWDYSTGQYIMQEDAFEVIQIAGPNNPTVNWISPNSGDQGQTLSVTISGTNMDYGDQWSGTLSDFRFSQWSGSNMFYGTPTGVDYNFDHTLYGDVSIPSNQNSGYMI